MKVQVVVPNHRTQDGEETYKCIGSCEGGVCMLQSAVVCCCCSGSGGCIASAVSALLVRFVANISAACFRCCGDFFFDA